MASAEGVRPTYMSCLLPIAKSLRMDKYTHAPAPPLPTSQARTRHGHAKCEHPLLQSLLHHLYTRAGLWNHVFCEPLWERGDKVFFLGGGALAQTLLHLKPLLQLHQLHLYKCITCQCLVLQIKTIFT